MSKVKRLNFTVSQFESVVPYASEHGQYVRYADYAKLEADAQALREEVERDNRITVAMALDISAVGEALGIPGEEQEGGTGEFIDLIRELQKEVAALRRDKARLDAIEDNCWDVRYGSSSNADAGDSSIGIEIVGYYQGAPHIRVLGESYTENLRAAIDQAMTAEAYPPERPEYDDHGRPLRALLSEQAGEEP
ncbi:TPA: hypothetical protein ACRM20_005270 [Pseudomonas aeruginosa]